MLHRARHLNRIRELLGQFPVVGLVGARQVGKTTLARALTAGWPGPSTFFDLEDPPDLARLESPSLVLRRLSGLVVLDEIQHRPDLFTVLRVLADREGVPARFLVLGSASPSLLRQASESLAGRIAYHTLEGFDLDETGAEALDRLWLRGGFPRAFTAASDAESMTWRRELIRTYLERDLPGLGIRILPPTLRRFWNMLAHYHGQTWNAAELARAFGVSEKTVRHYLDILVATFAVRRLDPWFENMGKRQVRAPKVYVADSGLLHALLGLPDLDTLRAHPKVGASWEGFAVTEVVRRLGVGPEECFFWGVHTGGELDLLVVRGGRRLGFEAKLTDAPRVTPAMRSAIPALGLERLDVLHAGADTFPLGDRIRAVALCRILEDIPRLG